MNWKNEIINKYPELFEKTGYKRIQFSCDEGWSWLIDNLCKKITNHTEENKLKVTITTIKEKFGILNVYCDGGNSTIWNYISFVGTLSANMCEKCGTTKHMGRTSGWIKNICYDCAQTDRNKKSWISIDDIPIDEYKKKIRKDKLLNISNNEKFEDV